MSLRNVFGNRSHSVASTYLMWQQWYTEYKKGQQGIQSFDANDEEATIVQTPAQQRDKKEKTSCGNEIVQNLLPTVIKECDIIFLLWRA